MKIIQDNGGFTPEELENFKESVYVNCISQMRCILDTATLLRVQLQSKEAVDHANYILKLKYNSIIQDMPDGSHVSPMWTPEIGNMIKILWADSAIQQVYQKRGKDFQLNDTANYFFDNIDRISAKNYVPTEDDVLRVRLRSTGIEEAEFYFDKKLYRVVDVGGQRSERRKWIHCFDGVSAVFFCASLAGYDLPLREDPRQNRLNEALTLFQEVCNQDIFQGKALIFFLNKTDLLREKLKYVPLEAFQPGYKPPPTDVNNDIDGHFNAASEFIKSLFIAQIDKQKRAKNTVFTHLTCALDTENIAFAITAVRKGILQDVLGNILVV